MQLSKQNRAINSYGQVALHSEVQIASRHRLIQMLMEGALEKIAYAKGDIERGNLQEKGKNIGWAISIINGLRSSLDSERGGDIASNLDNLYEYMGRCLSEANINAEISKLEEVTSLLLKIKGAWDEIPEEVRN